MRDFRGTFDSALALTEGPPGDGLSATARETVAARFIELAANQPSQLVQAIQAGLARLGNDPGPADGLDGARTRNAIAAFQQYSGLPIDGRATTQTYNAIRSALAAQTVQSGGPAANNYFVINSIAITAPELDANGAVWDSALLDILNLRAVVPDVKVCYRSARLP